MYPNGLNTEDAISFELLDGNTNSIRFDKSIGSFSFAGHFITVKQVIVVIAGAITGEQNQFVEVGTVKVTPSYLTKMIEFVTKEGWFQDDLTGEGQDHNFDPEQPTPGCHWDKVQLLRKLANEELALAQYFRKKSELASHCQKTELDESVSLLENSAAAKLQLAAKLATRLV